MGQSQNGLGKRVTIGAAHGPAVHKLSDPDTRPSLDMCHVEQEHAATLNASWRNVEAETNVYLGMCKKSGTLKTIAFRFVPLFKTPKKNYPKNTRTLRGLRSLYFAVAMLESPSVWANRFGG